MRGQGAHFGENPEMDYINETAATDAEDAERLSHEQRMRWTQSQLP